MFIGAAGQTTTVPQGAVVMEPNASLYKKKFHLNTKKNILKWKVCNGWTSGGLEASSVQSLHLLLVRLMLSKPITSPLSVCLPCNVVSFCLFTLLIFLFYVFLQRANHIRNHVKVNYYITLFCSWKILCYSVN